MSQLRLILLLSLSGSFQNVKCGLSFRLHKKQNQTHETTNSTGNAHKCDTRTRFAGVGCPCQLVGLRCWDPLSVCLDAFNNGQYNCTCRSGATFNTYTNSCQILTATTTTTTTTTPVSSSSTFRLPSTVHSTTSQPASAFSFSGIVKDSITRVSLGGVLITASAAGVSSISAVSDAPGFYNLSVPTDTPYRVTFQLESYYTAVYSIVEAYDHIWLPVMLLISEAQVPDTLLLSTSGLIINTENGFSESGVAVYLRQGLNTTTGSLLAAAVTLSDGSFQFNSVPPGYYTITYTKDGFITDSTNIIVDGVTNIPAYSAGITPVVADDEIRVVLFWGNDVFLEGHLTGPISGNPNNLFDIHWANGDISYENSPDGLSSFNIYTLATIHQRVAGTYQFYVVNTDYCNNNIFNASLPDSFAQVEIYFANTLQRVFFVPYQPGQLWNVFSLIGTDIRLDNTITSC